jgi:hypothetical protein
MRTADAGEYSLARGRKRGAAANSKLLPGLRDELVVQDVQTQQVVMDLVVLVGRGRV